MAVGIIIIVILVAVLATQASGSSTGGGILGSLGGALGGNLGADQIAGYASNAGFQGSDLVMSVAVALAESGGNPAAVGDINITPGGSVGLWQINLKAHPEYAGIDLTSPQNNADAAYRVYRNAGSNFSPWSAYNNGSTSNFLAQASAGVSMWQAANPSPANTDIGITS
jgi:hypothetical protein